MIIDDLQCGQSFTGMMNVAMNYSISIHDEKREQWKEVNVKVRDKCFQELENKSSGFD